MLPKFCKEKALNVVSHDIILQRHYEKVKSIEYWIINTAESASKISGVTTHFMTTPTEGASYGTGGKTAPRVKH